VRVEFFRPNAPDDVAGRARWDGRRAIVESDDDETRTKLETVFRLTPVVANDASMRMLGASGESVLQPGSLEWFRAAALTRAAEADLAARIVPDYRAGTGWDPAGDYRTFRNEIRRIDVTEENEATTGPD
jgi:hypothetical protein